MANQIVSNNIPWIGLFPSLIECMAVPVITSQMIICPLLSPVARINGKLENFSSCELGSPDPDGILEGHLT